MNKILNIFGTILITAVLILSACLTLPQVFGLMQFSVVSGSMEPTLAVGSLVYVKECSFSDLTEGDIIAFSSGSDYVTHRVYSLDEEELLITTKGDANESADPNPVAFSNVYGRVVYSLPLLGNMALFVSTSLGKLMLVAMVILGALMVFLAGGNGKLENKSSAKALKSGKKTGSKKILIAGILVVAVGFCGFVYIIAGYLRGSSIYSSLNEKYVTEQAGQWYETPAVDLEALQKENEDCVAWLYVENTDISYPVMFSGDDDYYLHRDFYGDSLKAGTLFLEGANSKDFSDSHSIIYGHNMRNKSMFGALKYFKTEEEYISDHKYFQIITKEHRYRYEIFSYFDTPQDSYVYESFPTDSQGFEELLSKLKRSSYESVDTEDYISENIVTLSTCSTTGMRFVVNGTLVDKY